jgi:hypothetical protein
LEYHIALQKICTIVLIKKQNKTKKSGHQGFTPVIFATQEAEIRRITVARPYLEKKLITKKGWWSGSRCMH